jgi:hypothetical protein
VVITSEGMAAIGVEQDDDEAPAGVTETGAAPTSAEAGAAREGPTEVAEPDNAATPAVSKPEGAPGRAAAKPTPRAGTKQAKMIEMLKRPEGATVEQIAPPPAGSITRSEAPSPAC